MVVRALLLPLGWLALACANDNNANANDNANDNGEYYHQFSVCENSAVVVEEFSLLCDSPGQYYYGSSKYRNSATCMSGDKAKYEIEVDIPYDLEEGTVPYITLDFSGYGTVESVRVYDNANLCELDDLWSLDGGDCPAPGRYSIGSSFYWGEQNDQYSYNFKPHVVVGISSQQGAKQYDLGGANTDNCQGGTFSSWTTGVRRSVSNTLHTFIITLSVLLGVILLAFSAFWYINRHFDFCNKDDDDDEEFGQKQKALNPPMETQDEEEFFDEEDKKRIAMMARERDLIDA